MYSSHFDGKIYSNPVPTEVTPSRAFFKMLKGYFTKPRDHKPLQPLRPFKTDLNLFREVSQELRITWLGHSSLLIEMDGKRILTDPVWYQRVSPFTRIGPKRFFNVPIELKELPPVDFILLSHDHYDHMDKSTLLFLTSKKIPVITMLKVGNHLRK